LKYINNEITKLQKQKLRVNATKAEDLQRRISEFESQRAKANNFDRVVGKVCATSPDPVQTSRGPIELSTGIRHRRDWAMIKVGAEIDDSLWCQRNKVRICGSFVNSCKDADCSAH
jgi:hypothetical protein